MVRRRWLSGRLDRFRGMRGLRGLVTSRGFLGRRWGRRRSRGTGFRRRWRRRCPRRCWGVLVLGQCDRASVSAYQIGSVTAMTKGRLRFSLRISVRVSFRSKRDHQRESPVSSRIFEAFCCRRVGPYVSLRIRAHTRATPEKMSAIQHIQRQPRYWVTKPPMTGPRTRLA